MEVKFNLVMHVDDKYGGKAKRRLMEEAREGQ